MIHFLEHMCKTQRFVALTIGTILACIGFFFGSMHVADAATLTVMEVEPASLVTGTTGNVAVSFTSIGEIPVDGHIEVTFPSGFIVDSATVPSPCTNVAGSYTTSVDSPNRIVRIVRTGGDPIAGGTEISCTIGGIQNPSTAGLTGAYAINTTTAVPASIDTGAPAGDVMVAATLTSTNVQPVSLRTSSVNTVNIAFTTINQVQITGKVKVTFPSGFNVTAANAGTCSSMDGSFATSVDGQTVIITRSGGSKQSVAAETCAISGIRNPSAVGSGGSYTVTITNSADAVQDTATVSADNFSSAASSDSSESGADVAKTYEIVVTIPEAAEAYMSGDLIPVTWETSGTGTISAVNLSYSIDGGLNWIAIVTNTANDASYEWTAPEMTEQDVMIRAVGTDLVLTLATDDSDAFSIGTNDVPTDATDDTSTDLLPNGTYMRGGSWTTVYYVADGVRYPFLDAQTFFTYADDFSDVVTVSDSELGNYTMGVPMMPKTGTVLVKVQSVNKVYALTEGNVLRWITSESLATELYGSHWADYVIDVPVTAWGHFTIGDDVRSANDIEVDVGSMMTRDEVNSK